MGLLDAFGAKTPQDKFAEMLLDRLKQGGETRQVSYDAESFTLCRDEDDQTFYLGNAFAEYERASEEDRENVVRVFLSTWFTSQFELPKAFDDAKADVLVTVRDRSYFEVDIPLCSDQLSLAEGLIYSEFAECLAIAPVYDMPTSIRSLSEEDLAAWDVTLFEVIEVARQNLREMTQQCAQMGELYVFSSGDSHDAARILLTDVIEMLDVRGAPVAMVPNRELLLVTGEDNGEALETMVAMAQQGLEHERRISSAAFRLSQGLWSPWLPEPDHPLRSAFELLRVQGVMADYERQEELFRKRAEAGDESTFLSRYSAMQGEDGVVRSYTIWPAAMPARLPRVDYIMFMASDENGMPKHLAAAARWEEVERVAGHLMTAEDCYPARYRVDGFPDQQVLEDLGTPDWMGPG
ncbi:hypothetical protein NG895_13075 [Aeoliella sp. ICT_H6.2]|uniref:DUF1444 family protein n=1 Tax=Aeoliella straminimaris TaxID=2954799 RepID=A0A9X2FAV3_9BACT|nr:hypothetical protein [Aeoliella straminimaris]MCO6044838.1 hypothetical protein [Aeoliella straminimaris]